MSDAGSDPGAVLLLVLFGAFILAGLTRNRRPPPPPPPRARDVMKRLIAAMTGQSLVDIAMLEPDLRAPLQPFLRRSIRYLKPEQLIRFYQESGKLIEERARLHQQQTELIAAQTNQALAAAMAEFVATLNQEERALLQMRIDAQARLGVDELRAENARLAAEVTHHRNLLPGSGRR